MVSNGSPEPNASADHGAPTTHGSNGPDNPNLVTPPPVIKSDGAKTEKQCRCPKNHDGERKQNWTLILAFVAAIGSAGAAISGIRQAWIASDTEQRQLRAYLFLSATNVVIETNRTVFSNIIFKNYGVTPADNVRHWACVAVRDIVIKNSVTIDPTDLPDWRGDIIALPRSIVPQGDVMPVRYVFSCEKGALNPLVLTDDEQTAVNANKKAIYLYGMIYYEDIFGHPHHTWYRRLTSGQFGLRDGNTTSGAHGGNEDD